MEYVNLGNTGLRVSRVCLGMMSFGAHPERPWALAEADSEPIIRRAVEGGITFFDTADVYNGGESEVVTGRVLPKLLSREELVIATKVRMRTMPGENGRRPLPQAHHGLDRRARCSGSGSTTSTSTRSTAGIRSTPIEETMEALHDVVKAGKARYIGASSMFAWQFAKAQAAADRIGGTRFVSMQNHYNLVYREEEREMIPQCIDQGVGRAPVEPARARAARRQPHARGREADDARRHRSVRRLALRPRRRLRGRRPGRRGRRRARRSRRAGGARLAAAAPRRDGADRRRDEGRATSTTRSPPRRSS